MSRIRSLLLGLIAIHLTATFPRADEAVEPGGKKHSGHLLFEKNAWLFRSERRRDLPLQDLSLIRFAERPIPLPKTPLTHTLVLLNDQRVTGTLMKVDEKAIVFVTAWGKTVTIDRSQVAALVQANDAAPILREDFETDLKAWQVEGKPSLDVDRRFFGKSSVRLDAAGQRLVRAWQPALRDGAIRLYFFDPGDGATAFDVVLEKPRETAPGLVIDREGYRCVNVTQSYTPIRPTPDWRQLVVELEGGRLRFFVDDFCVGQTRLPATDALAGLRIAHSSGKLWIDALSVTRKLQPLPTPAAGTQDAVWLEQGELLYGRVAGADQDAVMLQAKFGHRALPWSRLRGILFARTKDAPQPTEPEIQFVPGPGFSVDKLQGKLVRWEGEKLIVAHPLLGEVAIERERLHSIRMMAK